MDEGELLTTEEAAARLGIKAETVMRALKAGKMGGRKLGRSWLVTPADVQEYRQRHLGRKGWDKRRATGKE